jgi:hypothetical protein
MEEMESKLHEMQIQMMEMRNQMELLQTQLIDLKEREAAEAPEEEIPEPVAATVPPSTTSKFPVRFYGKVKMDVIYDSNILGPDEYITFIPKNADGQDQVSFTARETRFGLATGGPTFGDWNTSSRVETDFYGSVASSGSLRIRLAYINLTNGKTTLRFGQDWLPIATLNPATTNFTIMGYNGNLWGRIPQITVAHQFSENVTGVVSTFRCRDQDDDELNLSCDLLMPWVATGLRLNGHLLDDENPAYLGLGVAYRQGTVEGESVAPNLFTAGFNLPWHAVALTGEVYTGQGLGADYLHKGGAFNLYGEPIHTSGGFVQIGLQATQSLRFNVGYGYDNPLDSDLVADEFYQKNTSIFGNTYYNFTPDLSAVLETTWVETEWSTGPKNGYRIQSPMIFLW